MSATDFKLLNEGENWKQTHGTATTSLIDEYQNIIRQLPLYTKGGKVSKFNFVGTCSPFQTDSIHFASINFAQGSGHKTQFDIDKFCQENVAKSSIETLKKDVVNCRFLAQYPKVWKFILEVHASKGFSCPLTTSGLAVSFPKFKNASEDTILSFFKTLATHPTAIPVSQLGGVAQFHMYRGSFLASVAFSDFCSSISHEQKEEIVSQVQRGDYDAKLALDKSDFKSIISLLSSGKSIDYPSFQNSQEERVALEGKENLMSIISGRK
jgi:hypothetical protein